MDLLRSHTRPIAPEDVDDALDYIRSRALVRQYAGRGQATMAAVSALASDGRLRLEFQDWALMDPSIPSTSGRERDASAVKTVELCDELGLLRVPPGTLQTHGTVLCSVARGAGVLPADPNTRDNPFAPRPALLATAFFHVLRSDRVFLLALLRLFANSNRERAFSGDLSAEAEQLLRTVEEGTDRTAANREAFRWFDRQKTYARRFARALEEPRKKRSVTIQTLYRPMEDLLLPRLEFLVDVGALSKPRPADFSYVLTEKGQQFRQHLGQGWDIETQYFRQIANLLDIRFTEISSDDVLPHLSTAYAELRNAAGYAPIEEAVLLANAKALAETPWNGVELAAARAALADVARSSTSVRIVSDRHRRPGAFRIRG